MSNNAPVFIDAYGNEINTLTSEREEQLLAFKYVPRDSCGVLELGARYGTVTNAIYNKIKGRPIIISVELDETVWNAFENNMIDNNIHVIFVPGVISRKPQALINIGYSSFTVDLDKVEEELKNVQKGLDADVEKGWLQPYTVYSDTKFKCVTLEQILEETKIPKIDTLVADCEGFLEIFFDENPNLYTDLKVLIYEADGGGRCNYAKIEENLIAHGFRHEVKGFQNVWLKT